MTAERDAETQALLAQWIPLAATFRGYYTALIAEGFTDDEAMALVAEMQTTILLSHLEKQQGQG